MDDRRAKRVNEEAARKSTETSLGSHGTLLECFVETG